MTKDMMFGLSWEQIQAAQQCKPFRDAVDLTQPAKNAATDADRSLLAEYGVDGLRAQGMNGVLDRLNLL